MCRFPLDFVLDLDFPLENTSEECLPILPHLSNVAYHKMLDIKKILITVMVHLHMFNKGQESKFKLATGGLFFPHIMSVTDSAAVRAQTSV